MERHEVNKITFFEEFVRKFKETSSESELIKCLPQRIYHILVTSQMHFRYQRRNEKEFFTRNHKAPTKLDWKACGLRSALTNISGQSDRNSKFHPVFRSLSAKKFFLMIHCPGIFPYSGLNNFIVFIFLSVLIHIPSFQVSPFSALLNIEVSSESILDLLFCL